MPVVFPTRFGWSLLLLALVVAPACATSARSPLREAVLLSDKGQTEAALRLVEEWLATHPDAIPERRLAIRLYGVVGRLDKARFHGEELGRKLGSTSPLPFLELGHALELAHQYDEALALYDHASAVAPRDASGPRTGGMRAAAWGELELAEPRLSEATRRDPTDATTWHALGVVRVKQGNLSGGEEAYRAGVLRDPTGVENRVGLATVALLRGDARRVLEEYDAILRAKPEFVDAHLGRSWALVKLGRFDEARATLTRAEALGADRRSIARQRAWLRSVENSAGRR